MIYKYDCCIDVCWSLGLCLLSVKVVGDQKAVKAAAVLFSVRCAGSLCRVTKPRKLRVGGLLLIRSWLRSFARKELICLLGLTRSIIAFPVLFTGALLRLERVMSGVRVLEGFFSVFVAFCMCVVFFVELLGLLVLRVGLWRCL